MERDVALYGAEDAERDHERVRAILTAAYGTDDPYDAPGERHVRPAPTVREADAFYDGDLTSLGEDEYVRLCRTAGLIPNRKRVTGDLMEAYAATDSTTDHGRPTTDDIRDRTAVSPFDGGEGPKAANTLTHNQALMKLTGEHRTAGAPSRDYAAMDDLPLDAGVDDLDQVRVEIVQDDMDALLGQAEHRCGTKALFRDVAGVSRANLSQLRDPDGVNSLKLPVFTRLYRTAAASGPRYDLDAAADPEDTDLVERWEHPRNGTELYRLEPCFQRWLFGTVEESDGLQQHWNRITDYRHDTDRGIAPAVYHDVLDRVRDRYAAEDDTPIGLEGPGRVRHPLSNLPQYETYLFDDPELTSRELQLVGMGGTTGIEIIDQLDGNSQRKARAGYLVQHGDELFRALQEATHTYIKSSYLDLDARTTAVGYMLKACDHLGVLDEDEQHSVTLYRRTDPAAIDLYADFFQTVAAPTP